MGFLSGTDTVTRPVDINNNGRDGVRVNRTSYGRVVGNDISDNDGDGVRVQRGSNAEIADNDTISSNTKSGISLSTGGSADIDENTIENNTERGISLSTNASVRLSDDPNQGGANIIQENDIGIRCRLGGALTGDPQDFGTGNPGGGDHTDDTDISGSCPTATSLGF